MPRSSLRRYSVVTAVSLLASLVACKHVAAPNKQPLPVHTAMVQSVAVGNSARYSASIVPYSQVDLAFQSSGYVDHVRQVKSAERRDAEYRSGRLGHEGNSARSC